jgi:hypothetical protein
VLVGVTVGSMVAVLVAVTGGLGVAVLVGVAEGVRVGLLVAVPVGLKAGVSVGVAVGGVIGVFVVVAVGVTVGVGVATTGPRRPIWLASRSVNQRYASTPAAMPHGVLPNAGRGNSLTTPLGVMRPIWSASASVKLVERACVSACNIDPLNGGIGVQN